MSSILGGSPSTSSTSPRDITSPRTQPPFWSSSISSSSLSANGSATSAAPLMSSSTLDPLSDVTSTSDGPFRSLIAQKERELHDINEYRLKSLEEAIRVREETETSLRGKFKKLKDDFVFNLRLIEERDRELDKYETTCDKLKTYVREREKDIANMKIEMNELKTKLHRVEEDTSRKEVDFQHQLRTTASHMEASKWESEQSMQEYETRMASLTARLEETLRERAVALESQESVLKAEARRVVETNESRLEAQEKSYVRKIRDVERRMTEYTSEIHVATEKLTSSLQESDRLKEQNTALEATKKKLEWELTDSSLTKDREIQTLIKEKNDLKTMKQTLLDEYETKMSELLQSLHAVEGAFVQQREQYELQLRQEASSREEELRRMSQRLQSQLTAAEESLRSGDRAREDLKRSMGELQNKDQESLSEARREAESTKMQVAQLQTRLNNDTREAQGKIWSLDMELKSVQENGDRWRDEGEKYKVEVHELRTEMERNAMREGELKRVHSQESAGWQQRWERERNDMQERHDQLVTVLQSQRDHVETESRSLETRVVDLERANQRLQEELNESKAELRKNETIVTNLQVELRKEKAEQTANAIRGVTMTTATTTTRSRSPRGGSRHRGGGGGGGGGGGTTVRSSLDSLDDLHDASMNSDDLGPLPSPMRPLDPRTFDDNNQSDVDTAVAARELELENQKLKAAVAIMARQMEEIQQQGQQQGQHQSQHQGQHQSQHQGFTGFTGSMGVASAESPLKTQLTEAERNIMRLNTEKETLMEVSNQLRADLNHALSSSVEEKNIKAVTSKVQRETSKRYETKMTKIESRLHELQAHNHALTSELSKWTLDGSQSDSYDLDALGKSKIDDITSHKSDGSRVVSAMRASSHFSGRHDIDADNLLLQSFDEGTSDGGDSYLKVPDSFGKTIDDDDDDDDFDGGDHDGRSSGGGLLFYARTKSGRTVINAPSDSSSSSSEDHLETKRGGGGGSQLRSRLKQRLKGDVTMSSTTGSKVSSSSEMNAMLGGGSVSVGTSRRSKSSSSSSSSSSNSHGISARERLQKVRESLELVATKPVLHQQVAQVSVSGRMTKSQKKRGAKMKAKMRERHDLVEERRKVRKYLPSGEDA